MTIIDEISIAANQLANEGKKPSVALIKAKLGSSIPLPTIINTLKSWQHQPEFISPINEEVQSEESEATTPLSTDTQIQQLIQDTLTKELAEMKQELSDMKLLIKKLSKQLEHK